MTDPSIPTIRLDDPDEAATVASLRSACVDVGFFYLEGHGISPEFLDSVMAQSKALFDLPLKEKLALQDPILNRGYTGMEEETLDPAHQVKGDTKEGFYIGKDVPLEQGDPAKLTGPNQWPPTSSCPDFQATMASYQERIGQVGLRLVQLLALAMGLDDKHYFDNDFADPIVTLRLLHYAKETSQPEDGIFACGAHSDYGMLTFLLTDENPGLEIFTQEGSWLRVPPKPSAFVVNLGDMLERWTNGAFKSTLHRVVTAGDTERYSIPVFYDPHFDTVVEVLDVFCQDGPAKYPPTTVGGHLMQKYRETHAEFEQ
jgi:isopenicillin N synthase-like dioxygenase